MTGICEQHKRELVYFQRHQVYHCPECLLDERDELINVVETSWRQMQDGDIDKAAATLRKWHEE